MFRKIEIWILYLVLLLSILSAIGFGVLVRQELVGNIKVGWVSKAALNLAEIPMIMKKALRNEDLAIVDRFPYLNGFNGSNNTQKTYLLLSRYNGDLKEGVVELIDLSNFKILHAWNPDIDALNDLVLQIGEFKYLKRDRNNSRYILRHPKLTKDGGLLFQYDSPLRKIDACSGLMLQNSHDMFHHSIETDIEDNIWVPSHPFPHNLPEEKVGATEILDGRYYDDAIVKLSPEGGILYEKSVSQIFIDNGLEYLLFAHGNHYENDPIHLNDIQPVDFDGKYWKKGDVFLSLRSQSMIILYRPSTNSIIWKGTGPFLHQHDVDILDDKRISIFNNRSINIVGNVNKIDGNNEIIIYDFEEDQYSSYLSDALIKYDIKTVTSGRGQILPNGDLFIEESNSGRTLYFNADGSLRWSHVNRADNGIVYSVGWSRILYTQEDIQIVNNFLKTKGTCSE